MWSTKKSKKSGGKTSEAGRVWKPLKGNYHRQSGQSSRSRSSGGGSLLEYVQRESFDERKQRASAAENASDAKNDVETNKKRSKSSYSSVSRTTHGQYKKYSLGGDRSSILMDWTNTSGWHRMLGFNLELWWRRSSYMHRVNAGFVVLCLTIFVMNASFGVWLIWKSFNTPMKSPYICTKPACQKASRWITEFMNTEADPCTNFYDFVCGKYHFEKEKEGGLFSQVIYGPEYPIEFGENSILAKILKNYRHDPSSDQPVQYYRNCLNVKKRREFGLEALLETVEYVFGTRDFSTFETSSSLTLEKIGSRMFQTCGHASYINMVFFTYPYVQIIRPSKFITTTHFYDNDGEDYSEDNELFVTRVFEGLLPLLGVPKDSPLITDMVKGVEMMTAIIGYIDGGTSNIQMPKSRDNVNDPKYKVFEKYVNLNLLDRTLCPPMGVNLNMSKVLEMFLVEKDYRMDFLDLMSLKYFLALQICFKHDTSTYTPIDPNPPKKWTHVFTYPKSAFVSIWLLELFWDYHTATDGLNLLPQWSISINDTDLIYNKKVWKSHRALDSDTELQCLTSMWKNLGYMSSIRFLLATQENPAEFITDTKTHLVKMFHKVSNVFQRIPPTEIAKMNHHLGRIIFGRGLRTDFVKPLVGGLLEHSSAADLLPFTEDHLRNALISVKYTVEKARQNWLGSTDPEPTMRWWGDGEPNEIRYELLDLREPMVLAAKFVEVDFAGNNELWETFQGQPLKNYILYPLSILHEPHITETLALKYGGSVIKLLRSFFRLIEEPYINLQYASRPVLVDFDDAETANGANRGCSLLRTGNYTYDMEPSTVYYFTWTNDSNFFSLLAVKEALRLFREERKALWELPYGWTVKETERNLITQRYLPGKKVNKFSEEQLFFISYVRHTCRGSYKTHNDYYKKERFLLQTTVLTILMQMEEFSLAWQCKKKSFMNNNGEPRCMRWNPS